MAGKKTEITLGLFLAILLLLVGLLYWSQYSNPNSKPNYGTPFLDPESNLSISGAIGHFPRFGTDDQYIMFIKITNQGEPLYYSGISAMLDSDSSSEGRQVEIHWLGWELNGSFKKALLSTDEKIEDQFEISDGKGLVTNSTNGKMLINITLENDQKPLGSFYTVLSSIYANNGNPAELKVGEQRPLQFIDEKSAMIEVYGPNAIKVKNCYINTDKYNESIKAFDKAIEMDPKNETALNGKADALSTMGRYEEAIRVYDQTIEINANNSTAWKGKGDILNKMNKFNESIQAYDKAVEINPKDADAWYGKGNTLESMDKYNEAIQAHDKAIEINPQYAYAWDGKGISLDKLGRHEEANACYKKASELSG